MFVWVTRNKPGKPMNSGCVLDRNEKVGAIVGGFWISRLLTINPTLSLFRLSLAEEIYMQLFSEKKQDKGVMA
jgi:hypothetical protein